MLMRLRLRRGFSAGCDRTISLLQSSSIKGAGLLFHPRPRVCVVVYLSPVFFRVPRFLGV